MSILEFENFLTEMKGNNQFVIILDFQSKLSGDGAFKQVHQDALVAAGLMEDIFHLKVPFDRRCCLAGFYAILEAPALVAVSVYNKMTRERNAANLA